MFTFIAKTVVTCAIYCNLLHAIIACNLLNAINCTCNHGLSGQQASLRDGTEDKTTNRKTRIRSRRSRDEILKLQLYNYFFHVGQLTDLWLNEAQHYVQGVPEKMTTQFFSSIFLQHPGLSTKICQDISAASPQPDMTQVFFRIFQHICKF